MGSNVMVVVETTLIAEKRLNSLRTLMKDISNDMNALSMKMSAIDKQLSEMYHKIETSNANAATGYQYYREIQVILRKRRLIKDEIFALKLIKNLYRSNPRMSECEVEMELRKLKRKQREYKEKWKQEDFQMRTEVI